MDPNTRIQTWRNTETNDENKKNSSARLNRADVGTVEASACCRGLLQVSTRGASADSFHKPSTGCKKIKFILLIQAETLPYLT